MSLLPSTPANAQNAADTTVTLTELSVAGRGNGQPPPTGLVGQPPAPYAGGQVGSGTRVGLLGNQSVFNTPFNVTSYTDKLIRDQQSRTITDVVDNDPSIRTVNPRNGSADSYFIRGFPVNSTEIAFDGLYGIADLRRAGIEGIERVEILKGPSTLINGIPPFGSVGGSINLIPKRATDEPLTRITTSYISDRQFGTHLDVGRRFGPNNEWGIRFNGVVRDGNTPIQYNSLGLGLGAVGLDYRGERLRLSVDLGYQEQDVNSRINFRRLLPGIPVPKAPRGRINPQQPWEFFNSNHRFGTLRAEYDLTDQITVYAAYGHSRFEEISLFYNPSIFNARGDFRPTTFRYNPFEARTHTAEAGMRAKLDTGPVKHSIAFSAVGFFQEFDTGATTSFANTFVSNIYQPILVPSPNLIGLPRDSPLGSLRVNKGVALADTMSILDERVLLTIGGRFQEAALKSYSPTDGQVTSRYKEGAFSPAVGLVVKPLANLSLYGNYIEGLTQGDIAPTDASNSGEIIPPVATKQVEVGAKYDFGTVGVSVAAFSITQPNIFTDPVTSRFSADGKQRNQGFEFNVFGEPAVGFRLLGGVALLDGRLIQTAGNLFNGNVAPGVPDVQLNLYGEYDLPFARGLTLTGRVIHTSSQFYDQENTQKIPDWTRLDFGARLTIDVEGKPVTVRATVENVFDLDYWQASAAGFLTPGTPRTYLLSASFNF